jgi:cell wall-associated NlpC family hydrolase
MISQPARILANISVAALIGFVLCACSSQDQRKHQPPSPGRTGDAISRQQKSALSVGEQAAVVAVRQLGVPYRYGGNTSDGFDCSGLVHYAYSKAGQVIPRTTNSLWRNLPPVAADNLRVGDLLFFNIDGKVSHVGLYLGSRRFVHAPSSGRDVTIEQLDSAYYRQAFVRGGRP